MHPALSIILFTTLSGAGFGLCFWVGLLGSGLHAYQVALTGFASIGLASAGLLCSVFHLRRPSRAWRAFSQWRSSWLSREALIAPASLAMLAAFVAATALEHSAAATLGWIAAPVALLAVFATSMIYTQLKAVAAWHTMRTPLLFLAYAISSGFYFMLAMLGLAKLTMPQHGGGPVVPDGLLVFLATTLAPAAFLVQYLWWRRRDAVGFGKSSAESATGLGNPGSVRMLEPPHTGANYLTSEMGYVVARRHAAKLRWISAVIGAAVPAILCLWAGISIVGLPALSWLAAIAHLLGAGIARWLFFAEARHTVMLYYQ